MSYINIDGLVLCVNANSQYITASNDQLEIYYITEYKYFTQIASAKIVNNVLILEVLNGENSFDINFRSRITHECQIAVANAPDRYQVEKIEEKARIDNTFMRMRISQHLYQVKAEHKLDELRSTVEELRRVLKMITI